MDLKELLRGKHKCNARLEITEIVRMVNVPIKNVYGNKHRSVRSAVVLIAVVNPPRANGTDKPGLPRLKGTFYEARSLLNIANV